MSYDELWEKLNRLPPSGNNIKCSKCGKITEHEYDGCLSECTICGGLTI